LDGVPDNAILRGIHCFYCYILRKLLYAEVGRKTGKTMVASGFKISIAA